VAHSGLAAIQIVTARTFVSGDREGVALVDDALGLSRHSVVHVDTLPLLTIGIDRALRDIRNTGAAIILGLFTVKYVFLSCCMWPPKNSIIESFVLLRLTCHSDAQRTVLIARGLDMIGPGTGYTWLATDGWVSSDMLRVRSAC